MARFKPVDMSPRFLPIVLEQQVLPGTFENALQGRIDTEFDLAPLHANYINDDTGAPAYDSAILLKTNSCLCPAGKQLYRNGGHCKVNGKTYQKFTGAMRDCVPCTLRPQCLRTPDKTTVRQVAMFYKSQVPPLKHTEAMKHRIDSPGGRKRYGRRMATVEPVFGNLRHNKQLDRFTLRGQKKVVVQWKLYCLMHNIEKLAHHGYAQ